MHFFLRLTLILTLLAAAPTAFGEPTEGNEAKPDAVSYYGDIRPIFQAHCQGCHQPAKQGGEYEMTSFARLLSGGESGVAAIVPAKPNESYLIEQITPAGDQASMPKGKPALPEKDRQLIARWIAQGAKDDSPLAEASKFDMDNPPDYPALPVVTSLDYSPDGELLAVSGYHEVLLHRADGSGIVGRLVGLSERIESVAFSPDGGRLLVTGGSPGRLGEVQIWNVNSKELLVSVPVAYDTCYGGSWSPDGKLAAFGCPDATLRALNAETGEQVLFNGAHSDWVFDTVFSVKGTHLVSVSRDRSMKLVDVSTERFIDNITSITPGALKGGLHAVDIHPTKDELAIGGADGIPKIYRMFREKARKIGDDFNKIREFEGLPGRLFDVTFSPNGERLAAVSSYHGEGECRVYQVEDGKMTAQAKVTDGGLYAAAFSPDNKVVAFSGFDGKVRLMEAETGKVVKTFDSAPMNVQ